MNLLLAAKDTNISFFLGLLIVILYFTYNAVRALSVTAGAAPKKGQVQREKPSKPDPQRELESFLRDIGLGQVGGQRQTPPPRPIPKSVAQVRRHRKGQQDADAKSAKAPPVRQRHLDPSLARNTIHSTIKNPEPETALGNLDRSTSSREHFVPTVTRSAGDPILSGMLSHGEQLSRAFILGTVFGPPLALRDD